MEGGREEGKMGGGREEEKMGLNGGGRQEERTGRKDDLMQCNFHVVEEWL